MHLSGQNVVRKYWLQEGKLTLCRAQLFSLESHTNYIKAAGIKFQHKVIYKC